VALEPFPYQKEEDSHASFYYSRINWPLTFGEEKFLSLD